MRSFTIGRRAALLAGAAAICGWAPQAFAAADAKAEAAAGVTVGEIMVTSRHRAESLQSVPLSVEVLSGADAAARNLNDIADISATVPAVNFRTGASNKDRTVFIRGIGTISTSPGVEPSVSTVVDGVVLARAGQSTVDLLDLDRLEVLEGPQGTLFGKNASAGVINVVTKTPTDAHEGYIEGSYFEGEEYRVKAGVSGKIAANTDASLAVFDGVYKGNVTNIYGGKSKEENGFRHTGFRLKVVQRPTDSLKLTWGADYTNSMDTTPTGVFVSTQRVAYPTNVATNNANLANLLTANGITPSADNRTISTNNASSVHDKNYGFSLQADWQVLNGYTVTSITAYREWRNTQYQDFDMLSAPTAPSAGGFAQGLDTGRVFFHQTSQELRLASPKGKFIDYQVGAFFLNAVDNETYQRDVTQINASNALVNNSGLAHFGTDGSNFALFGEANINFTPKLRAIVGVRGIWDWLSYYHNRVSTSPTAVPGVGVSVVNPANPAYTTSQSVSGYADRFGLQYDLAPSVMAYFTYSRGYKGPGFNVFFNMGFNNDAPLAPETSNAYEIGLKSTLFDHRLRANLSGFITDFDNYQANFTALVAGAIVTNVINAGSVRSRGFEGDFNLEPGYGLSLEGNLLYDDAKVVSFNCPVGAPVSCNINNQPLPFAPKWKLHLGGQYKVYDGDRYGLAVQSDYNWQSKVQYQLAETPDTIQPAYGIWNASLALTDKTSNWSARLLVKNILDKHYSPYIAYGALAGVVRWVPRDDNRYFGVNIRKTF